jgi:thiamine biosynthesis lipoprotein
MPEASRLAEALRAVGYRKMRLHPEKRAVELLVRGMKLDLGGIAKGYALDQEMKALRAKGIDRALVSGGGDMVVSNPPPGERGWRIELAPLDSPNAPEVKFLRLANTALATSGDTFQRLEIEGRRYSHVVDPRTGVGLTDHSLVTIIAPDATTADGLSKVASVLGPEKGLKILQEFPNAEARVVRKPGEKIEVKETPGFRRFFEEHAP